MLDVGRNYENLNMSRYIALYFLLSLQQFNAFGQISDLISSKNQSEKWVDSLKNQTLSIQLKMISDKFLSGSTTKSYYYQDFTDSIKNEVPNLKKDTNFIGITCQETLTRKPYFVRGPILIIVPKNYIYINDKTDNKIIAELCKLLKSENISSLTIIKPETSEVLFGGPGIEGTILLYPSKKKIFNKFKKLKLENYN